MMHTPIIKIGQVNINNCGEIAAKYNAQGKDVTILMFQSGQQIGEYDNSIGFE